MVNAIGVCDVVVDIKPGPGGAHDEKDKEEDGPQKEVAAELVWGYFIYF